MDIKSNGIKYSYGMKFTALLLAVVCVFSSAWCCVEITKMLHDCGWENLLVREDASFYDTTMFYNELATAAQQVKKGTLAGTWEEEREKYGTLESEQARALEQFRAYKVKTEAEAQKRYTYHNQTAYDDTVYETTEPYTNADGAAQAVTEAYTNAEGTAYAEYYDADAAQSYLNSQDMQYRLQVFSSMISLDYTMTEDEVLETVASVYNSNLATAKRNFESSVVIAKEKLSAYTNFRYLAVNRKTGETYSNCGATAPDAFFALFNNEEDYVIGYTAEKGLVHYSDAVSIDTLYDTSVQVIGYDTLPDYLGEAFGDENFDIYLCLDCPMETDDAFGSALITFYENTSRLGYLLLAAMLLLAAALILSIYLLLVAGRVRDVSGIQFTVLDNIPTDIHLVMSWGLIALGICGAAALLDAYVFDNAAVYYIRNVSLLCIGIALLCAAVYAVLIEWATSTVKLTKAKKPFVRSMLTAKFLRWCVKKCKIFFGWLRVKCKTVKSAFTYRLKRLPKKAWLFAAVYVGINALLILLASSGATFFFLLCLVAVNVAALALIWKYVRALDTIIIAAEQIKLGEQTEELNTAGMPEPLKSLAQNLTYTQEEMQKAVQEAIKGERMKTELITNVSHDLKTPLTSIISYVDLLKKCDILDTDAQKYITVLDEKSIRLKRLIEDLVEASKASSGAVTLNKMQVNLYELAVQAVGEMEDGFAERDLKIILNTPQTSPVVFADSQKTWRIMDNLLSNARKYSLGGTRVYVDVKQEGANGIFTIKNVSGDALNIDPEELTQRFVRGDASRTLEGSGLGLSIAKDLCRLQDGALKLEIDGDLFKATVSLPLYQGEPLVQDGSADT